MNIEVLKQASCVTLKQLIELLHGLPTGEVNYDQRQRNHQLETSSSFANASLSEIIFKIEQLNNDDALLIKANFVANQTICAR